MEEQNKTSTSSTSGRGGGERGDGDVEQGDDDKHGLSPAAAIVDVDDHERKIEKARLNQDLVFSNDLVSDNKQTFESRLTLTAISHVNHYRIKKLFINVHSCYVRR